MPWDTILDFIEQARSAIQVNDADLGRMLLVNAVSWFANVNQGENVQQRIRNHADHTELNGLGDKRVVKGGASTAVAAAPKHLPGLFG